MKAGPREFAAVLILNDDEELLLLKRSPEVHRWPGRWGIAGGGMEPGESPAVALRRELREELGRDVRIRMVRGPETLKAIGGYGGCIHIWVARWVDGNITLSEEHTEYAWVDRDVFRNLDIMPGVREDLDHFGIWRPSGTGATRADRPL